MRILINGNVYDSTETPILIQFDENEQDIFGGLRKFVSAPEDTTLEERQTLIEKDLGLG